MKGKYYITVCLSGKKCLYKRQDKKTKLPICIYRDEETGEEQPCNQQFEIIASWAEKHKPTLQTLRYMKYKYIKAGIQ